MKKYSELRGFYIPSFFFIQLETKEKLENINQINPEYQSAFIHEYIHFIQDVTTTYGLKNIISSVNILKTISSEIQNDNNDNFELPIRIPLESKTMTNIDLESVYEGDLEIKSKIIEIIKIEFVPNELITGYEQVPNVEVQFINEYNQVKQFNFGSICITESMANLIETELFDNVSSPIFPYKTCEIITEYLYPEVSKNRKFIVALCDVSLNTYHSGEFFIELLKYLKEKKITEPIEIYRLTKGIRMKLKGIESNSIDFIDRISKLAENEFNSYFTIEEFSLLKKWSSNVFKEARELRSNNYSFWLDILNKETKVERLNTLRKLLMDKLGIPLLSNLNSELYFYNENIKYDTSIVLLRGIVEVHNVLRGIQSGCRMKMHCKNNFKDDITNSYCDTSPWKRCKDDYRCTFAVLWKMWGFCEKDVVVNNN